MRRAARVVVPLLLAAAALSGCHTDSAFDPPAQFAPSLRPAFGARVDDGQLKIWTGTPCVGVTRLAVSFDIAKAGTPEFVLVATPGATVERLTVGTPPTGMTVKTAVPATYDWRSAGTATLSLSGPPETWGSNVTIDTIVKESAAHPNDTYYFQDVGWLDPAQVAQQNGKTFVTTCTADPGKTG